MSVSLFGGGDRLDENSPAFTDFDSVRDRVFMAEMREASTHVWSTKPCTAFFFAAMCHFAQALRDKQITVDHQQIGSHGFIGLVAALADAIKRHQPQKIVMIEPGNWRVEQTLRVFATESNMNLAMREDTHCRR